MTARTRHWAVVAGLCLGVVAGFLVPLAMSCGSERAVPTYNPMDDT